MLPLSQKNLLKKQAHSKKPIILIGNRGLTLAVHQEIERALLDHELVKIKVAAETKKALEPVIEKILAFHQAELIQHVGKTLVIYRKNLEKTHQEKRK